MNAQLIKGADILIADLECAYSMGRRMKGLLGRAGLARECALHIDPCSAIHTLGMRFSIDVIFLDASGVVLSVSQNIKPWTFLVSGGWRARSVIELETGWFDWRRVAVGDRLSIQ